jgi:choline dehydrogenase-like flavoprotein
MTGTRFAPRETVDFLIIGSGAAGGVIAKELSVAGFSVIVLEQGPWLREKDFTHDEIKYTINNGLMNDSKTQPVTFRANDQELAKPLRAIEYGRQVGGGSVHFTGNYWRFHQSDFHERSLFGEVPGTGFADWPIRYKDLEPWYTKAEHDLGISGQAGANPFEAPRSKPYPLPPMPVKSSGVLFERATKKLGLHPFPAPVAILSKPYVGRGPCTHCGFCELFGCEIGAKSSTLVSVIPVALKAAAARSGPIPMSAESPRTRRGMSREPFTLTTGAVRFSSAPELWSYAPTASNPRDCSCNPNPVTSPMAWPTQAGS